MTPLRFSTDKMKETAQEAATTLEGLQENISILIMCKEKNWAVHRTAELLTEKHNLRTFNDTDEIRYYNGGTYHQYADAILNTEIQTIWGKDANTHTVKEILNHIRRSTYTPREQWNQQGYINLENGVIEVSSCQLVESTPDRPFTYSLPIYYNPEAKCPAIDKFLNEVFKPEDIPTALEIIGYCLYTGYPIHRAVLLFGGGGNGKSTYINLIKKFLGPDNTTSISLQQLSEDQYSKSWLYGKLANLYADLEGYALKDTGVFKILTGGDMVTCNVKYGKDSLTFTNHAKMIFSANRFPQVYDDSDAFFRRWIILKFDRVFSDADADKDLLSKLTTQEELSGLLNLALEALKRLLKNGCFTSTQSIEETRAEYTRNSDSVGAFIIDCIEQGDPDDEEYRVAKESVYNTYLRYTKDRKIVRKNEVWFWKDFRSRIEYWTTREKSSSGVHQVLKGIKLKDFGLNPVEKEKNIQGLQGIQGIPPIVLNYSEKVIDYKENTLNTLHTVSCAVLDFILAQNEETYDSLKLAFVNPEFSEADLKRVLEDLRVRGLIYEPKPGLYRAAGV